MRNTVRNGRVFLVLRVMYHYFYKITNKLNGKFYLGVRTSKGLPEKDYYMGSGTAIRAAIRKYGKENFSREIIKCFDTQEEAYEYERQHVTLKEVLDPNCYNMQIGGVGGTKGAILVEKDGNVTRILPGSEKEFFEKGYVRYHRVHSDITLDKMSKAHKGCKRSEAAIRKTVNALRELSWMHRKDGEEARVPRALIDQKKSEGWILGRDPKTNEAIRNSLKKFNRDCERARKVYVHKDGRVTVVPEDRLQSYLDEGWVLGNGRKGKRLPEETKQKISRTLKSRYN